MLSLKLLQDIDDVLNQLIGEGSPPELVQRARTLRRQLPGVMTWVQSRDAEITRVLQEIDRHHQAWAGREQERAALRELYLKSMAPTGAAMYLLCWIMAHNHWRTFWLVGPFDGLAAADQWAKDYLEDDTCFPVEWSGDPADIRVLSPNPVEGLL